MNDQIVRVEPNFLVSISRVWSHSDDKWPENPELCLLAEWSYKKQV